MNLKKMTAISLEYQVFYLHKILVVFFASDRSSYPLIYDESDGSQIDLRLEYSFYLKKQHDTKKSKSYHKNKKFSYSVE